MDLLDQVESGDVVAERERGGERYDADAETRLRGSHIRD